MFLLFFIFFSKVFKQNLTTTNMTFNETTDNKDGLAYDLRQRYAIQLGDLRARILEARSNRDYLSWYDSLDCLYVEIIPKLEIKEKEEYSNMINNANSLIKRYAGVLNKKSCNIPPLYSQLRKINIWLNQQMDDVNMFGSVDNSDYGGL